MKSYLPFVLLCISLVIFSCVDEPQPVEPSTVPEEVDVNETASDEDDADADASSSSPDSAFYRARTFSGMPYQIMYPRKYDSTSTYPLIIFLHGIDERGTDNRQQLKWGASLFQSDSVSKQYPAFVVFPQCRVSNYWHEGVMLRQLKSLVDNLVKTNSIDAKRIYIEGLSMGAYGTYAMVAEYPDLFAAAIAIAGDGDEKKADRMAKVDWKIYGGKKDTRVPGEKSEKMAAALRKSGANVSVKIYPDADHQHTWTKAFAEPDFVSWVFERVKK
jgi:predicted peptidase